MSDSSQQSSPAEQDRVWGLCTAIVFGSFFLLFCTGLFRFDDPEWTILAYALLLLFTVWSGLMTAGGIGMLLRRGWGERLAESCLGLGAIVLFTGMVASTCWQAFQRIIGSHPAERGDGFVLALVLVWTGLGSLLAFGERKGKPLFGIASDVLLWPFLLLLKAPTLFGVLFATFLLFVGGGDWLGSRYGHPYLGATIGLAGLVALFAGLARLSRRWD